MALPYHKRLENIVRRVLPESRQAELLGKLDKIEALSRDKVLRIAVIGEFSSGKSTFINALLGTRLLEEGVFPTTASATYLRTSPDAGGLEVQITFRDKSRFRIQEDKPPRGFWRKILYWPGKLLRVLGLRLSSLEYLQAYMAAKYGTGTILTVQDAIRLLTSCQEVAQHVARVEITLPQAGTEGLPENILLIDTPGFNPGQESVQNHLEVTQQVVENEADLAIILTPSGQAMSHTLLSFLANSISAYLHRCVFVITKADLLESDADRREVLQYAHHQLAKNFQLKKPMLFAVAARCMLPVKYMPEELRETWEGQQENFRRFQQQLWSHVETGRKKAVSEHGLRLLAEAVADIDKELDAKEKDLSAARQFIEDNKVSHIRDCTQALVAQGKLRLQAAYDGIDYSPQGQCDRCCDECIRIIRRGGRLSNFANKEGKEIQASINNYLNEYREHAAQTVTGVSNVAMGDELLTFDREFTAHYKDMPALRPKGKYQTQLPPPPKFKIDKKQMAKDLEKVQDKTPVDVPLFGKVRVPAGLADILGFFFKVDERELQDKFINKLKPQIRSTFHSAEAVLKQQAKENMASLATYLDSLAALHIKQYSSKVERIMAAQERKLARISQEHGNILAHKNATETIQTNIRAELDDLKFS